MAKKAVRMMDKVMQTVEIAGKAIVTDVRRVYAKSGKGVFGVVFHEGQAKRVKALGNQCWQEVA